METYVDSTKEKIGNVAAEEAIEIITEGIAGRGFVCIILATGASQFEVLKTLTSTREVDWSKVVMFHLDEYIDLPETHPASFRKYLMDRFISQIPRLKEQYLINGTAENPQIECERLGKIIAEYPVDIAFVGIGENGHLAFNDPPADFKTDQPYIVVQLDEDCRKQQMGGDGLIPLRMFPIEPSACQFSKL